VRQKKPAVTISEGVFNSEIGSFVIKVGKKYPDGIRIEDIVIYDHSKKSGNNSVTVARSGRMEMTDDKKYLILTLKDGINYDENTTDKLTENNLPMQITRFSKEVQRIDLSAFEFKKSDRNIMRNSYQMLNVHQLIYYEDSLLRKQDSVLYSFGDFSMKDIGYYNMFYKEDTVIVSGEVDPYSVIYKPDTSMENRIANTEHLVDEVPKLDSKYKFDSEKALLPDFIQNFDSTTQVLVASSALTLARMSAYQSTTTKNRISSLEKLIIKFKVEWHRKYTLSVACIILFFIGAPLGAIIRKGGLGMPLVISIIMFVLYHVLTIIGEKAAKSQILEPWFGMWLASMIYFPLGVFITYKATTDAPLLDSEAWQRAFARINIFSKLMNSKNATRK
jgi:lipopolysaccharide export system permease protein